MKTNLFEKEIKQITGEAYESKASPAALSNGLADKLLLAVKTAGIGVWEYCISENKLIGDEIFLAHYGLIPARFEIDYELWLQLIHPEDRKIVNQKFHDALINDFGFDLEFRNVWADGSVRHNKSTAALQYDNKGNPLRLLGANQNITKAKEAEQVLKENEAKYHSFFDNTMDGILITQTNGNITAANPAACAMFGMTEEEICESGRDGLLDTTDPRLELFLNERSRTGKAKAELTHVRKDGSFFPGETTSAVFKDAKGCERSSIIIRNVTDRKITEQKVVAAVDSMQQAMHGIKKIMDSSLDIICTINGDGKFVNISSAAARIWGYQPQELADKNYMYLVYKKDAEQTAKTAAAIMSGIPVTTFENRCVHKNGTLVPVLWSARWDEKDKLMYCVAKDATEKKKLEKALETERQRFYDLFLQAPISIGILKGENHVYEMANTLYLQLIGKKNIIGKTVKEVLPEAASQGFIDVLNDVYKTGKSFSANEMLVNLDLEGNGKYTDFYLNILYQAYRNNWGEIEGIFFFTVDVTEQVLSRKKIEQSEKKYRQIVDTAQEGIWMIDEHNQTSFVNHKMSEMLGYSVDEILGKDIRCFMDEEERKNTADRIKRRKNQINENFDLKYITKSGKPLWVNVSANPVFYSDGKYSGALAMITDITERKVVEESNLFKAELLKNIGQAVMATDLNGIISYWNKASEEIFGWCAEEAIGNHIANYGPADEAKDLASEGFNELFKGKSWSGELLLKRKDGTKFMAFITDSPVFDRFNKLTGIIGIVSDITDRKLSEEKMQEMQEQLLASQRMAHIGSWHRSIANLAEIKSSPVVCSEEALRIMGLDPNFGDMSYEKFLQIVHPEDINIVREAALTMFNEFTSYYKIDHRIIRPDGTVRWVSRDAKFVKDENTGQPVRIIGTIKDITVAKEQERQLQKSTEEREMLITELTKSVKDLQQYTYITSHNFRAPLTNLIGLLSLIDYSTLTEANKSIVEMFESSTLQLNSTINDLVNILIIKNNVNLDIVENSIPILLDKICNTLLFEMSEASCVITKNLAVENICFNKSYLESILINLLSNAIKYRSPNRSLQITVSTEKELNGDVLMIIQDNGIGIDVKRHGERIFGLYQRFHTNADSVGLGLFMVKSQITALGGSIEVESEVDKGTAFYITFRQKKMLESAGNIKR